MNDTYQCTKRLSLITDLDSPRVLSTYTLLVWVLQLLGRIGGEWVRLTNRFHLNVTGDVIAGGMIKAVEWLDEGYTRQNWEKLSLCTSIYYTSDVEKKWIMAVGRQWGEDRENDGHLELSQNWDSWECFEVVQVCRLHRSRLFKHILCPPDSILEVEVEL